jgi:hypothetical protein
MGHPLTACRLSLTCVVVATVVLPVTTDAEAAYRPRPRVSIDRHPVGNGRGNRNTVSDRSPTFNRGNQQTSNSNAGGLTNVQNALCKQAPCVINQKVNVIPLDVTAIVNLGDDGFVVIP